MVGNRVAPVGTGSGQMCAPDVGQGGFRGTKEIWSAAGPAGRGCALHRGLPPHLPRLKQAWVPDVSAGRGRQEELSAGRDHRCSHPHASPARGRAPPRPPPLHLAHFGAAEVPVTLEHHGTGWLLEPLLASPSLGCTLSRCLRFAFHFGSVTWEVALGPQHPWPGHCSRSL